MRIEKKTWPEYFEKVLSGEKTFDLRLADFECKEGDELVLKEWDPETKDYTGREIVKDVGFVLNIDPNEPEFHGKEEIERHGYYIISLK